MVVDGRRAAGRTRASARLRPPPRPGLSRLSQPADRRLALPGGCRGPGSRWRHTDAARAGSADFEAAQPRCWSPDWSRAGLWSLTGWSRRHGDRSPSLQPWQRCLPGYGAGLLLVRTVLTRTHLRRFATALASGTAPQDSLRRTLRDGSLTIDFAVAEDDWVDAAGRPSAGPALRPGDDPGADGGRPRCEGPSRTGLGTGRRVGRVAHHRAAAGHRARPPDGAAGGPCAAAPRVAGPRGRSRRTRHGAASSATSTTAPSRSCSRSASTCAGPMRSPRRTPPCRGASPKYAEPSRTCGRWRAGCTPPCWRAPDSGRR